MTELAPAVDVVVATRNRPDLLLQALAAIHEQDHLGDLTVHLVFDQSPVDHSFASNDPRRRVVVLANDRTPGLAGARNCGIAAGTAPLVCFCDDDDVWLPTKVSSQIATLTNTGSDTCVTGIHVEYADRSVPRVPTATDLALDHLVRNRVMEAHPSTVMVRRDALVGPIGEVDEEIPGSYGEDFDWIIRAAQHGPIAVTEQPLVRVRWGTSQFSQNWDVIVRAIDYGLLKHDVFSRDRRALARLYGRRAFALAALHRTGAFREVARTAWTSPRERRAYLAAAVALRLVSAERLMHLAHRRGHGI